MIGLLALVVAAFYSGAALYVNVVEQPASFVLVLFEVGRSAGVCPARGGAPRVIINPERLELELGDLVLKRTLDGGYLCIGFGRGARFLEAVSDDRRLNTMIDLQEAEVLRERREHPLWNDDRHLRRLGIALSIARAGGYDPDEPRDERGRWTQILAALKSLRREDWDKGPRCIEDVSVAARWARDISGYGSYSEQQKPD